MESGKSALILGIAGQDGSYLAELLLAKGYEVHGVLHDHADLPLPLVGKIRLHSADLTNQDSLKQAIAKSRPAEVYNLAGRSFPPASWDAPLPTAECNGLGTARLLEAVRQTDLSIRLYQASSSELFGNPSTAPQNESTPFAPTNPYGVSKLFAHWMAVNYRERYGLFVSCGILYNHESPRRPRIYVTRKITRAAAEIKCGLRRTLELGNLDAVRDWGYAADYVQAMWLMLQQEDPADYVIATGKPHSVRELCEIAFGLLDLDWRDFVRSDPALVRPADQRRLVGNASRASKKLGWHPSISFKDLVELMVNADLRAVQSEASVSGGAPL